jgi:predicted nucleic-acid-binding Zn-ribbon protein
MKKTGKCPKCANDRILIIAKFKIPGFDSSNICNVVPVYTENKGFLTRLEAGYFDIRICEECGYTEFYTQEIENVKKTMEAIGSKKK